MSRSLLSMAVVLALAAPVAAAPKDDAAALLALHERALEAHRRNDVDMLLSDATEDFVVGGRGRLSRPTVAERRARLGPYLAATRFSEYRDLEPPVVKVSKDGTLGWVIARVIVKGTQKDQKGAEAPLESTWVWIELYEKRDGRWVSVGNVSSAAPAP